MRKRILKSLSYTFSSNLINLLTSFFLVVFVPRFIGVESYSYWQLYIFYTAYLQYLTFGIPEGIYLEYGGSFYNQLPKCKLRNQYLNLFILTSFFTFMLALFGIIGMDDNSNKGMILLFSAIALLLIVPRSVITYELQATDELKTFSLVMIQEKIVLILGIITIIVFKNTEFRFFIMVDLFSKLLTNVILIYISRSLIFGKLEKFSQGFKESMYFCKNGINITLSNISSILVSGIIRMGIELKWSILVFGKVSLIISMTNMIMVFINSISLVFFPMLKRMNKNKMKVIFVYLDQLLSRSLVNILILYFPVHVFLQLYLPAYASSLKYLIIIFPMTIFESKIAVLYNTYLKALRMEKKMFQVNAIMVLLTLLAIYPMIWLVNSLEGAIFVITLVSIVKSYLCRRAIFKNLNIKKNFQIPVDMFIALLFILAGYHLDLGFFFLFILLILIIFNLCYFKKLKISWQNLKRVTLDKS